MLYRRADSGTGSQDVGGGDKKGGSGKKNHKFTNQIDIGGE